MAGLLDLLNEIRRIKNQNNNETFDPAFHSLEAIATSLSIGPSVGLWMFGIVDATQVASTVTVITNNLQNVPNDTLEGQFWMQVIYNTSAPATAPEGEIRRITNFVQGGALQTFTVDAFSANVEAGDMVVIFHESLLSIEILGSGTLDTDSQTVPADSTRAGLYAWENNEYFKGCILMPVDGNCRFQPRPIASFTVAGGIFGLDEPFSQLPGLVSYVILRSAYPYQRLIDIFNLVNAILVTTEVGGTLTTDGTEQDVYINNAPAGIFEPRVVKIDLGNLAAAETVVIRTRYRYNALGGMILEDEVSFTGVQAEPSKSVHLDPNRFGIEVTLERTVGAARDHDWYAVYRG